MSDFIYYNVNPAHLKENDCVLRAITQVSGLDYEVVKEKLYYTGMLLDCHPLCVDSYSFLLNEYFQYKKMYGIGGMKVRDFVRTHREGIYLMRMEQHLSTNWYGKILDLFDCSDMIITDCWKVE